MAFDRILLPTDFSAGSAAPVACVRELAGKFGSKVYVLHVIFDITRDSGWHVPAISMDEFYAEMRKGAEQEMQKFVSEHLGGIETEQAVVVGTPYEEIFKSIEENRIDIVVMGTHGRTGIDRVLFGSTASRVVRRAPCPVLTVRMPGGR